MGVPQTSNPSHLYPQSIQLKLYQAFIFSVPILFSIILFLLFYLFYLKRRRDSELSSPPSILPRRVNNQSPLPLHFEVGLKEELKEKLPIILFDEDLRAKDSICCVCLGDFELKEQLQQIPYCKHVFHIECIHHWLQTNFTCPLCRCSIFSTKRLESHLQVNVDDLVQQSPTAAHFDNLTQLVSPQQEVVGAVGRQAENPVVIQIQMHNSRD
ncbi:hypothetical protein GIB67_001579 [Kingdonia uniflora]|uniref:RING-type E3 ubiquitin transferase n=1 Tax=Kingdonia uniflora TaxID=39325 RepID=A0A7J7L0L2_9MAGN|nr:hypothetical protein GIB67_001579 [Kingdonia uniflora]